MHFGGTFTAPRSRSRGAIPSIVVILLFSIMTGHAAWSRAIARHSAKHHIPKHHTPKLAALTPDPFIRELAASKASRAAKCDPAKFRIVLDVGHTAESEGAISARNVAEFVFNLHLAQRIVDKLKAEGFAETRLLVTEGKSKPSLFKRVAAANAWDANLFLSIHHDSVPNSMLEDWEFDGKKSHFSDRFSGYSVFVSRENPDFRTSLRFADLVGKEMKAAGLQYAHQYTQAIMGRNQHELLNEDTGVYRYDELIVLRKTQMPAVLLEAGSISNRDEELEMKSPERQDIIASGVAAAVKEFCDPR
jgi:N-acetylmuramoyl-L-alanine amidase